MSDAAFATAAYPAYTTVQLTEMIAAQAAEKNWQTVAKMATELHRRSLAAAGDVSVMTPGEHLRWARR